MVNGCDVASSVPFRYLFLQYLWVYSRGIAIFPLCPPPILLTHFPMAAMTVYLANFQLRRSITDLGIWLLQSKIHSCIFSKATLIKGCYQKEKKTHIIDAKRSFLHISFLRLDDWGFKYQECPWDQVFYFGHLTWRASSLEKTLMLGKIEGKKRRGGRGWDG